MSKCDDFLIKDYIVYILKCSDESYYTGVTNNLEHRKNEHKSGYIKGYTSNRIPVTLVFSTRFADINEAIRFEKQIKGWGRKKKEALINSDFELLKKLSKTKTQK